jgi:hypothetical protein
MTWNLRGDWCEQHATITESTTQIVACGESWCDGRCGLPALVLQTSTGKELRAFGPMVACGPVFGRFRIPWTGEKRAVSLGSVTEEEALKRFWM